MKNKRLFYDVLVSIVITVLLVPLTVSADSKPPPTKASWKMFAIMVANHAYVTDVFKPFAQEVKQKTNGQLEITVYTPGELPYKGTELLMALKNREIEMAELVPTFSMVELPLLALWQFPFLNTSLEEHMAMRKVLLPRSEEALNKQFNIHWLFNGRFPLGHLFARKPVKTLADLKGLQVRTYGSAEAEVLNALGAVGIAMTAGEVYTALQRGTVEAVGTSYLTHYTSKWHEVANHGLEWNSGGVVDFVGVKLDAWNALPKDVRKTVEELANKYQNIWHDVARKGDDEAKQKMVAAGGQFVTLSAQDRQQLMLIMKPLWQKWAKGIAGGEELLKELLRIARVSF